VTCRSKKQSVVARSNVEAEYRAIAQGICEMICLGKLMGDLQVPITIPTKLYCDSKSAINIVKNLV